MSSAPNSFPISLRSWASDAKDNDPKHLPTIIQRINFERGGFHNITEESLRQEIAEAELSNDNGEEGSSEEEEEEEPDRAKELLVARDELLMHIEQAHQAAMLSTEVISAALSKETPVQASLSMSQELRGLIGMGTLGMDKLHAPRITSATREDNKASAKGWKVQSLNKSVDSILASAERLKAEVEHETIFWGQVLAISDNHWAVCRLPYDKHTLGVRFGFSEASAAFKDRSLGALRRSEDGTITLDQGLDNAEPQILRVRIRTGTTETGVSRVPRPVAEDAPIESLILEARNTIFAQELWQELNRESRALGAYGVRAKDDTLVFPLSKDKTIIVDLVPLGDSSSHSSGTDDFIAEGITIALSLLLSLAHRHNHRKRTQPPVPFSIEKQTAQPYNILRPFLTRIKHQETISQLHSLLRPLTHVLKSVLPHASPKYNLKPTIWELSPDLPKPAQVLMRMSDSLEAITVLTITEDVSMTITTRSGMSQIGSHFTIDVTPALAKICPPPQPNHPFSTFSAVREYIFYATACGLSHIISNDTTNSIASKGWQMTAQPNILKKAPNLSSQKTKQLAISISLVPGSISSALQLHPGVKIRAIWEWSRGEIIMDSKKYKDDDNAMQDVVHQKGLGDDIDAVKVKMGEEGAGGGAGWYRWQVRDGEWDEGEGVAMKSLAQVIEEAEK